MCFYVFGSDGTDSIQWSRQRLQDVKPWSIYFVNLVVPKMIGIIDQLPGISINFEILRKLLEVLVSNHMYVKIFLSFDFIIRNDFNYLTVGLEFNLS